LEKPTLVRTAQAGLRRVVAALATEKMPFVEVVRSTLTHFLRKLQLLQSIQSNVQWRGFAVNQISKIR
jgi:hypothetical protein